MPQLFMTNQLLSRIQLVNVLRGRLIESRYAPSSIELCTRCACKIIHFMEKNDIDSYSLQVGMDFLMSQLKGSSGSAKANNVSYSTVRHLNLIVEGISIAQSRHVQTPPSIYGDFEIAGNQFLDSLEKERLIASTIASYRHVISRFSLKMSLDKVDMQSLRWEDIAGFISSITNIRLEVISKLRRFLFFLHTENYITRNFSDLLSGVRVRSKDKLPSVYLPQEILEIESSVNRAKSVGKRDFAIILLASRLGLRRSDICNLCFSNLDWERNLISIRQSKTNKYLELPLLNDVGEAIIDYILHGRPNGESSYIFLTFCPPFEPLRAERITAIAKRYIRASGVEQKKRHQGSHALRHSLATTMMCNGIQLEVISGALGHESVNSTTCYLAVNVAQLKECAHEVSLVSESFYEQEGGVLYD